MRTLKKVLALTMVIAMSLTFIANAAFKDEVKMNTNLIDDINLVSALGIMKGDGDSSGNPLNTFSPERVLKRGEAAKIIYVMLTGTDVIDEASWTSVANRAFADTKGHWSDAYVNFVAKEDGIFQGTTPTTFEPEATLTGTQFAKMLLCLVGYKSGAEGYTGTSWAASVLRDGQKANLFMDYTPSVSAPVTREWAAKMIVNAIINVDMVGYYGHYNGTTYEIQRRSEDTSYGEKVLNLYISYAMAVGNNNIKIGENVSDVFVNNDGKNTHSTFAASLGSFTIPEGYEVASASALNVLNKMKYNVSEELVGHMVKIVSRHNGVASNGADPYTNVFTEIYGVYAADTAVTTTIDAVKFTKQSDSAYYMTVDGAKVSYKNSKLLDIYADYALANTAAPAVGTSAKVTAAAVIPTNLDHSKFVALGANDNRAVTMIDYDEDGYFDAAFVNTKTYGIVNTFDSAKYKFSLKDSATGFIGLTNSAITAKEAFEKYSFGTDMAENKVVSVAYDFSKGKEAYTVELMKAVSGSFTEFTYGTTAVDKVAIDGTFYSSASGALLIDKNDGGHSFDLLNGTQSNLLNKEYNLYTDGKFYVYGELASETFNALTSNIAMVMSMSAEQGNAVDGKYHRIKVMLADGTVATYNYKADSKKVENGTAVAGSALYSMVNGTDLFPVFEYVLTNDGKEVYFKSVNESTYSFSAPKAYSQFINGGMAIYGNTATYAANVNDLDFSYNKDSKTVTLNDGSIARIDPNAVIFIKYTENGENKFLAIKGSELKTNLNNLSLGSYVTRTSNGMKYVVMAAVSTNYNAAQVSSSFGIVNKDPSTTMVDGTRVTKISVMSLNGEQVSLSVKELDMVDIIGAHQLRNSLVSYKINADGYATVELITASATGSAAELQSGKWYAASVIGSDNDMLYVDVYAYAAGNFTKAAGLSGKFMEMAKSAHIWNIDVKTDSFTLNTDGSIMRANETAEGSGEYFVNALFRVNSDGEITDIIIDINGDQNIVGGSLMKNPVIAVID